MFTVCISCEVSINVTYVYQLQVFTCYVIKTINGSV